MVSNNNNLNEKKVVSYDCNDCCGCNSDCNGGTESCFMFFCCYFPIIIALLFMTAFISVNIINGFPYMIETNIIGFFGNYVSGDKIFEIDLEISKTIEEIIVTNQANQKINLFTIELKTLEAYTQFDRTE